MVAISHKTTPKDHLRNKVQYDENKSSVKQFKNYSEKNSNERKREITFDCPRILGSIIAFFPNVAGKVNSFIAC